MRAPLIAAVLIAALVTPSAARDRGIPAATPTGPAQQCIPLRAIRESIVRSDSVIDFRTGGDRYYRVTLPNGCPELGFERRFSYETSLGQLCANDIITVFSQAPVMRGASCGLAPFQPVRIARR